MIRLRDACFEVWNVNVDVQGDNSGQTPPPKDQDFDVPNYITYQQSFVFSVKNPKPIFFGAKPHISQDLILTGLLPAPAWGLLTKSHFCWLDEKGCKAEHGNWFLLRKNFVMTRAQLRRM